MFLSSCAEKFRLIVVMPCHGVRGIVYFYGAGDGWFGRVWLKFGGVIHRCCFWGATVCWVEHCLYRDSVPACGGNVE